jgi:hypothetical protein
MRDTVQRIVENDNLETEVSNLLEDGYTIVAIVPKYISSCGSHDYYIVKKFIIIATKVV